MSLKRLLDWALYGGTKRLKPYETACLSLLLERLPSGARAILEEQLQRFDLIQRAVGGRLMVFYFLHSSGGDRPLPRLSVTGDENRVARLVVAPEGGGGTVRVDVVLHRGLLSSLQFSRDPKVLGVSTLALKGIDVSPELTDDSHVERPPQPGAEQQGPLLQRLTREACLTGIVPPAPERERERFTSDVASCVPADYLELLGETNGFCAGAWTFHGTRARRIVRADADLLVLAEDNEWALCAREDVQEPRVWLYDPIADECLDAGSGFVGALASKIGGPRDD